MTLPLLSAIANHGNARLLNPSRNSLPTEEQIMALARGPHPMLSPGGSLTESLRTPLTNYAVKAMASYLIRMVHHPSQLKNLRNRIAHPQGLTEHGYRSSYARMAESLDHLSSAEAELDWRSTLPLMESKKALASARLGNMRVNTVESLPWVRAGRLFTRTPILSADTVVFPRRTQPNTTPKEFTARTGPTSLLVQERSCNLALHARVHTAPAASFPDRRREALVLLAHILTWT